MKGSGSTGVPIPCHTLKPHQAIASLRIGLTTMSQSSVCHAMFSTDYLFLLPRGGSMSLLLNLLIIVILLIMQSVRRMLGELNHVRLLKRMINQKSCQRKARTTKANQSKSCQRKARTTKGNQSMIQNGSVIYHPTIS